MNLEELHLLSVASDTSDRSHDPHLVIASGPAVRQAGAREPAAATHSVLPSSSADHNFLTPCCCICGAAASVLQRSADHNGLE